MTIGPLSSADDDTGPDTRAGSDADLADEDRLGMDVCLRMDPRPFFAQRIESHGTIQTALPPSLGLCTDPVGGLPVGLDPDRMRQITPDRTRSK